MIEMGIPRGKRDMGYLRRERKDAPAYGDNKRRGKYENCSWGAQEERKVRLHSLGICVFWDPWWRVEYLSQGDPTSSNRNKGHTLVS